MKIKIRTMTFGVDKSSLVSDELSEIIDRFFKISDYHTCDRFKPLAKLTIRQIRPVGVILVDFLGCKYLF